MTTQLPAFGRYGIPLDSALFVIQTALILGVLITVLLLAGRLVQIWIVRRKKGRQEPARSQFQTQNHTDIPPDVT